MPARRLLSDALRHDLGLTGTHVGCEHGVCGACTVLVDGAPMRSCLMFAVSAEGSEITTVEGLTNPDGSLGPVQQAFVECHGLQCGFCTPGFLTTITAGLRDNPTPDARGGPRHDRRQPLPLHRLPEHREGRASARRVELGASMTTKLIGPEGPAGRGPAVPARPRAGTSTTWPSSRTRCTPPCCAARTRTPGSSTSTSTPCSTSRACTRSTPTRTSRRRRDGRAAAAADPAPGADPRPHPVRAGQGRGQLRRRGDRLRRRRRPLRRRGRGRPDPGRLRVPAAGRRHRGRPGRRRRWCTTTCPATSAPGWSRTSATRRPRSRRRRTGSSSTSTVERSACMPMEGRGTVARWDPDLNRLQVWTSTQTSTGVRAAVAAKLGLDLGQVDVITPDVGGGFGVKINHPWPEELLVPMAARALGPHGEVHRGPARALHLVGARARPGAAHRGRLRRRRPAARARRRVLARPRRLHAVRPDRPDHHLDPAARPLQAAELPGRLRVALHQHRDRHALPRRRAAAGLLRHGAHDGRDRGVPRQGPRRGARRQLHPARRVPLRPGADLPGRPRAGVRLRRLPGVAGEDQGAGRLGRVPGVQGRDGGAGPAGRHRPGLLRRGHRRRALRGRPRAHRDHAARSRSRPA